MSFISHVTIPWSGSRIHGTRPSMEPEHAPDDRPEVIDTGRWDSQNVQRLFTPSVVLGSDPVLRSAAPARQPCLRLRE
jgi:hypothetical protein